MISLAVATREALLIARQGTAWSVEQHLKGRAPESIAVDPSDPVRLYVGTWGTGLWRSSDAGRSWEPVGVGIPHDEITAVAVGRVQDLHSGVVYAGTEPSTLSRSEDGGESWQELTALLELPSSPSWSFPPKPETHHVRWIETDPNSAGKLYVAIEAGALVRSLDGGETWHDHVRGGPIDTHTAATHREASGRLYSAAGDGYFESHDGGESWFRPMDRLRHGYLVGVAVDPGDPDTVVVSGASGPYVAYRPIATPRPTCTARPSATRLSWRWRVCPMHGARSPADLRRIPTNRASSTLPTTMGSSARRTREGVGRRSKSRGRMGFSSAVWMPWSHSRSSPPQCLNQRKAIARSRASRRGANLRASARRRYAALTST